MNKMADKRKVPELRFKGFDGEWEEKTLGEITDITTGKLDANAMKEDGLYDFFTSGIQKYKIDIAAFEGPAITIAGNGATVGYMHLADGKFNAYQRTYILSEFKANREFLFSEIGNVLPHKISQEARTGNIPYIVLDMLTDLHISLPVADEQSKIGTFFQNLDSLITLHQRKHDKLTVVKKAMLQKMFPKEGADLPEIRFKGFTEKWERRTLGEVTEVLDGDRGKNYPNGNEFQEKGHTLFLSAANVTREGFVFESCQYITEEKSNSLGNGKLNTDDIVLTSRGSIGHIAWYNHEIQMQVPFARINSGMLILRSRHIVKPYFITHFLKSPFGKHQINYISFGSAQPQLTKRDVSSYILSFPVDHGEQSQIGTFFQNLDSLITLQQRELDKLKSIKKACLEKMFV